MEKEYWSCTIGPTTRDKLPHGCDFPMRMAVQRAYMDITGENANHCWSGWGLSDYVKDAKDYAAAYPGEVHMLIKAKRDKDV